MICILQHIQLEVKKVIKRRRGKVYYPTRSLREGEHITLVNLFAPNKNQTEFYKLIRIHNKIIGDEILIVVGDFNSVDDSKLYRSSSSTSGVLPSNFRSWIKQYNLVDSWRFRAPF